MTNPAHCIEGQERDRTCGQVNIVAPSSPSPSCP